METMEIKQTSEGYNQVIVRNAIQVGVFLLLMVLGLILGGYIGAALAGAGIGGAGISLIYLIAAMVRKSKAVKAQQVLVRLSPEGLGILIQPAPHSFSFDSTLQTVPWSNVKSIGSARQGAMEALTIELIRPEEFFPSLDKKEHKRVTTFINKSDADLRIATKTTGISAEEVCQAVQQYMAAIQ